MVVDSIKKVVRCGTRDMGQNAEYRSQNIELGLEDGTLMTLIVMIVYDVLLLHCSIV